MRNEKYLRGKRNISKFKIYSKKYEDNEQAGPSQSRNNVIPPTIETTKDVLKNVQDINQETDKAENPILNDK